MGEMADSIRVLVNTYRLEWVPKCNQMHILSKRDLPARTGIHVLDVALGAAFGTNAYFPPMSNLAIVANCMFDVPS